MGYDQNPKINNKKVIQLNVWRQFSFAGYCKDVSIQKFFGR